MSVIHPEFGQREVNLKFWYTAHQLDEVGRAWQQEASAGERRLYVPPVRETSDDGLVSSALRRAFEAMEAGEPAASDTPGANQTGFEHTAMELIKKHIAASRLPLKIMLPFNHGHGHWTSLGISIKQQDGKVCVTATYSDSLSYNTSLPYSVALEWERICASFTEIASVEIQAPQVYAHTWFQPDGSACGVYCLENMRRALAEERHSDNPGPQVLRERQLLKMRNKEAVHGCSQSPEALQVLKRWVQSILQERVLPTKLSEVELPTLLEIELQEIARPFSPERTGLSADQLEILVREGYVSRLTHADGAMLDTLRVPRVMDEVCRPLLRAMSPAPLAQDRSGSQEEEGGLTSSRSASQRTSPDPSAGESPMPQPALVQQSAAPPAPPARVRKPRSPVDRDKAVLLAIANALPDQERIHRLAKLYTLRGASLAVEVSAVTDMLSTHTPAIVGADIQRLQQALCEKGSLFELGQACSGLLSARESLKQLETEWREAASSKDGPSQIWQRLVVPKAGDNTPVTIEDVMAVQASAAQYANILQAAIRRSDAGLLRRVCDLVIDFCARVLQWLMGGAWIPEVVKVNQVRTLLKLAPVRVRRADTSEDKQVLATESSRLTFFSESASRIEQQQKQVKAHESRVDQLLAKDKKQHSASPPRARRL